MNLINMVSVNTPVGPTDRVNMPEIVQQGGIWGSLLCSNSIDKIGRKCQSTGSFVYKYKNRAEILPLAFIDDLNAIAKCGRESQNMNTYLNTEIELKKLSFHISTESVNGKCLQMHVGKFNKECPQLNVHGYKVQKVNNVTYLGDKVSADARNAKNIQERVKKGAGIIAQIMKIIHKTSFGASTVEIALLLRESFLINGILTNAEVWHNLTQAETEELDKIDRLFFQKLCRVPSSTPKPAFYLEFGVLPMSILIKSRRLNYLHNILRSPSKSMLHRVFTVQWYFPSKGDWTLLVKQDLADFNIEEDLNELSKLSANTFKKKIKEKAIKYAFGMLLDQKEM